MDSLFTPAVPETLAGFRVQVLLTQEIDQATHMRDSLDLLFPDEWVYIVYETPLYKVRVGNYLERPMANKMSRDLIERGFKDSWVVQDLVIKNTPRKPPVVLPTPSDTAQVKLEIH